MYDTGKVLVGIVVFLIIFSSPFWINVGTKAEKPNPIKPTGYKECVESVEYMKAYHMDLLNKWRDLVVRSDQRYYYRNGKEFLIDGKKAEMSLTLTCMHCHNNKAQFCDQCHNYLEVEPYCWDCHIDPGLEKVQKVHIVDVRPKFQKKEEIDSLKIQDSTKVSQDLIFIPVPNQNDEKPKKEDKK